MHCTYKLRISDRHKNTFGLVNAYTLEDYIIPINLILFNIKCSIKIYLHTSMVM